MIIRFWDFVICCKGIFFNYGGYNVAGDETQLCCSSCDKDGLEARRIGESSYEMTPYLRGHITRPIDQSIMATFGLILIIILIKATIGRDVLEIVGFLASSVSLPRARWWSMIIRNPKKNAVRDLYIRLLIAALVQVFLRIRIIFFLRWKRRLFLCSTCDLTL